MRVFIGKYHTWIGPYQIVDGLFFWHEKYPTDELAKRWDYKLHDDLADWLASTWFNTVCEWIESKRNRKIKIKIHDYDAWNADSTLALIILPILKKLKESKHGSANVAMEDVPEHMRTTDTEVYDEQRTFKFYKLEDSDSLKYNVHDRWNWVMDEMIWAFEQLQPECDWEQQYWSVHPELDMKKYPEDEGKDSVPVRWTVDGVCDWDGMTEHSKRIQNGLRLFGVYYRGLWS